MTPSIATRIMRSYFLLAIFLIAVMALVVDFVDEDLEQTMLSLDLSEERDFLLNRYDLDTRSTPITEQTPTFTAYFVPAGYRGNAEPPPVLAAVDSGFTGEVNIGDNWYLVSREDLPEGRISLARNITRFELREEKFKLALIMISLFILGLSFVLSKVLSKRLITPLRQLSDHISNTPIGDNMPGLDETFRDRETAEIAGTFNRFLGELEAYVRRERSLVTMASHELRTPIAVISGAVEVMAQRGRLNADDATTLQRIKNTAGDMEENISAMLNLARHPELNETVREVDVRVLVREVCDDLSISFNIRHRVELAITDPVLVDTSPILGKVLIRNLVRNALEHTAGTIWVRLYPDRLVVGDEGHGLSLDQHKRLQARQRDARQDPGNQGLGLYIATLVSERLGWRLHLENPAGEGTWITVFF